MSQAMPSPPVTPAAPPPVAAAPTLVQAFVSVLTNPAAFFESLRGQSGLGPPVVFALVMGLAAGVLTAVLGLIGLSGMGAAGGMLGMAAGFGAIVVSPIVAVIFGSFVGGAIVHVISLIAGGKGTYEQSVRVSSYACALMPVGTLLGVIPAVGFLLSIVANLYGLYVVALGVITLHLADRKKTFTIVGVLAVIVVLIGISGYFAARAAKNFAADLQKSTVDLQKNFGEGSQFQRDLAKAAEEARKATEQMQKNAPQKP